MRSGELVLIDSDRFERASADGDSALGLEVLTPNTIVCKRDVNRANRRAIQLRRSLFFLRHSEHKFERPKRTQRINSRVSSADNFGRRRAL